MSDDLQRAPVPALMAAPARVAAGGGYPALLAAERPRPAPRPTAVQLSDFLAHELSSPLGVMAGTLYLLGQERLEGRAAELAGRASAAARELMETVDDLRALAGAVPLAETSADEAAAEAVAGVAAAAPGVRIRLRACGTCGGARVTAHRGLLRRAVRNLAQNAAEAAGPGGTVGVVVRASGGRVRITVWDDGPGVAPEHADRVFLRPFTTRPGGTGLGLLLVRSVAEVLGGSVSLSPRAPRGSLFRIDLPRAPAAAG